MYCLLVSYVFDPSVLFCILYRELLTVAVHRLGGPADLHDQLWCVLSSERSYLNKLITSLSNRGGTREARSAALHVMVTRCDASMLCIIYMLVSFLGSMSLFPFVELHIYSSSRGKRSVNLNVANPSFKCFTKVPTSPARYTPSLLVTPAALTADLALPMKPIGLPQL